MSALSQCNVQSRGRAWIASEGTDLREPHNVVLLHCYRNSLGLLHHILIHIGDLHLVLPEFVYPEYWHFDNELGGLPHVLPLVVHLKFVGAVKSRGLF